MGLAKFDGLEEANGGIHRDDSVKSIEAKRRKKRPECVRESIAES